MSVLGAIRARTARAQAGAAAVAEVAAEKPSAALKKLDQEATKLAQLKTAAKDLENGKPSLAAAADAAVAAGDLAGFERAQAELAAITTKAAFTTKQIELQARVVADAQRVVDLESLDLASKRIAKLFPEVLRDAVALADKLHAVKEQKADLASDIAEVTALREHATQLSKRLGVEPPAMPVGLVGDVGALAFARAQIRTFELPQVDHNLQPWLAAPKDERSLLIALRDLCGLSVPPLAASYPESEQLRDLRKDPAIFKARLKAFGEEESARAQRAAAAATQHAAEQRRQAAREAMNPDVSKTPFGGPAL